MTAYDPSRGKSSTQTVQHVWVNHDHDLLDVTLHADGQGGHATEASSGDKTQEVATKAHGSQAPPTSPAGNADETTSETIHTTAKHPWLTTDRGWVRSGDLHLGEHVVELDGHTATIAALHVHPGAAPYYNLTVSQLHTYAVGDTQAMVRLGMTNTRMKDFYDLLILARDFAFDGSTLAAAIRATLARRGTHIPTSAPLALTTEFADDSGKQAEWQGFLKRRKREVNAFTRSLPAVIKDLQTFLLPPMVSLATDIEFVSRWTPGGIWNLPSA